MNQPESAPARQSDIGTRQQICIAGEEHAPVFRRDLQRAHIPQLLRDQALQAQKAGHHTAYCRIIALHHL